MQEPDAVKILVVDDLPEKLLVYQTILEEPGQEVVAARSGAEALGHLLKQEFAVILLDVNMPDIDGFETAALIRGRKRCAHTPIIFVTAHADELQSLRGYAYGAVDYILAPVVADVLRTKVRVFVELFRKTLQVQRQAERLRELQAREHRRQLQETTERLDLALQAGQMGACEWDLSDRLISWSPILERIFGFAPGEFTGAAEQLRDRVHPDDRGWVTAALTESIRTGSDFRVEHRIVRPGGEEAWVELRGRVFGKPGADGAKADRFAGVCMDITERKRAEAELARYRARLEDLVRERTAELEASHERLRLADRLASIGTLAAGLGHDMGNLLLPVRMRIESLERCDLPEAAREDIRAIAGACEYLKRLSRGLRLFALNPEDPAAAGDSTSLPAWWADVSPFLRNALPKGIALEHEFPEGLPALAISPHVLTQAVYNLVQNAGDAMRARGAGRVTISAEMAPGGASVVLNVADDGPGMPEEVRRRCMEPFFTTKTRGISTGLGLALVRGCVENAHGSIDIRSRVGEGTTFRLTIPAVAASGQGDRAAAAWSERARACVCIADRQFAAYVSSLLRSMDVDVVPGPWEPVTQASVLVLDDCSARADELASFLEGDDERRAIVLDAPPAADPSRPAADGQTGQSPAADGRAIYLGPRPAPSRLRSAVSVVLRPRTAQAQEAQT